MSRALADADPVFFSSSEDAHARALQLFLEEKALLMDELSVVPGLGIEFVGSAAVPGLLTKGDIDIQIRVPVSHFLPTCIAIEGRYEPKHRHIHDGSFAVFTRCDASAGISFDCLVTVQGSPKDDFYAVRDMLLVRPDLVAEYNVLKRSCQGMPYGEYRKAKSAFFGGNGMVRFLRK